MEFLLHTESGENLLLPRFVAPDFPVSFDFSPPIKGHFNRLGTRAECT
jgi:hypothetical protein